MKVLLSAEKIQDRVAELGRRINEDYQGQSLTIIGVLTGSLIFVADLVRQLTIPLRIGFIKASSYRGETNEAGRIDIFPQLLPPLLGRHVLLMDDIFDTGQTLDKLLQLLRVKQPASLRVAVLLRKKSRHKIALEPDYCGFDIPDAFVIGYGLDYNDQYRQLPYIGEWTPDLESQG